MSTFLTIVPVSQDSVAIKEDIASISVIQGGQQGFSPITSLEETLANINPFITYEPDFWLLSGDYKFARASENVGWMTTSTSAANTNFGLPVPELRITFNSDHSTSGLTLYFSEPTGDYADSIIIGFYNSVGGLITSDTYTPSSGTFATNDAVSNFRRIDIFINSMNKANRFARLTGIDFDEQVTFSDDDIKNATLIESINPLSVELPVNTLDFTLFSDAAGFSIVNPTGTFYNFRYKEPLDAYETIENSNVFLGRFYLDEWESISENEARIRTMDALGVMGTTTYLGFLYLNGIYDATDAIDDLMTDAGFDYTLDASLASDAVEGWIPIGTHREGLQQILFGLGAYATCARSRVINILPTELASDLTSADHTLTSAELSMISPLRLKPLVTGAELTSHAFSAIDEEGWETFQRNVVMTSGTHQLLFERPVWEIRAAGATVLGGPWRYNHATISVPATQQVTITGSYYLDAETKYAVNTSGLPAGTPTNVIRIHEAYMVNPANLRTTTQRVYDYYQQRYLQETRLFGLNVAPADSVDVAVQNNATLRGIIERMETDLTGGFVSKVEIIGVIT